MSMIEETANNMVASAKGILAADESSGTIKKRFDTINVESTQNNRRNYREMLFRTTQAMKEYISGVILFDETIRQKTADGIPLIQLIKDCGSIPGIKVDKGAKPMAGFKGETITEGLDGLRERLAEYYQIGARFAKWRAVINIAENIPSCSNIIANSEALARYAALCQEANIVPIVEPEVLMDGDHDIDRCYTVTCLVLSQLFNSLKIHNVKLEGTILKPNMIIAGKKCDRQASAEEVAEKTVKCFKNNVPAAIPGIVFLSGGQSDEDATKHLNAMNAMYNNLPWKLSFSYGRALQAAPLKAWSGQEENITRAQQAFLHRAHMNSLATLGKWQQNMEQNVA